jgi:hypothetical protein
VEETAAQEKEESPSASMEKGSGLPRDKSEVKMLESNVN